MMHASVFRLSMAHPGDLSALAQLIADGATRAEDIVAIIGKTEGNGGVNDFTRGYFTQTLMALLAGHLGKPATQLIHEIPCVLSGGTERVMSPHYLVFSRSAGDAAPAGKSALAVGTAFSTPVAPEGIGRRRAARNGAPACPAAV